MKQSDRNREFLRELRDVLIEWLSCADDSSMGKWECAEELWDVFKRHECTEGVEEDD